MTRKGASVITQKKSNFIIKTHNQYQICYGYIKSIKGLWSGIFNSCNTGTSGLPDMYTQSPRAAG